jgi:outer membrane receptor protein involved in Fe transport
VEQRYAWLLDDAATLSANVATGKVTYNLSPRQKIIGYVQRQSFWQSEYFLAGISQPVQTRDAMPSLAFPVAIWKGEYNASFGDAVYFEARAASYLSDAVQSFNSTEPRIADTGANTLRGGSFAAERRIARPQVNGSMSVLKSGWAGSHTFRIGAEYMNDRVDAPHLGYGHPCNCISTLANGVPTQVQVLLGPNISSNVLVTAAGFLDDTWRLHRRLTVSLGARLDRYQSARWLTGARRSKRSRLAPGGCRRRRWRTSGPKKCSASPAHAPRDSSTSTTP